ncbi:MAG: hypothetical protein ABSF45_13620 [Terriglobia bacterium]|jgi:hypothetical protein
MKSWAWTRYGLTQWMLVAGLTSVLLCILTSVLALGQIGGPVPAPLATPRPVPPSHLYFLFLMSVNRSDRLADRRDKQGRSGDWIRNSSQNGLGFSDEEFAPIRATAQRLEAELKELDAQAKAVIDADHAAHPLQPETHAEVQALQEQHKADLESEVAKLRHALGPSAADRLDIYVQTHIDPKLMTHLPQPSSAPDPNWQQEMFAKYSRFLRSVSANDRAAAMIERRGQDGSGLRNSHQNALGFNDGEFALIRATAQRAEEESNEYFVKERTIIKADPATLPPPPELRALSQKREDTIENEVSALQRALGPHLSARLDGYIHAHLQPHEGTPELDSERSRVFRMETSPSKE